MGDAMPEYMVKLSVSDEVAKRLKEKGYVYQKRLDLEKREYRPTEVVELVNELVEGVKLTPAALSRWTRRGYISNAVLKKYGQKPTFIYDADAVNDAYQIHLLVQQGHKPRTAHQKIQIEKAPLLSPEIQRMLEKYLTDLVPQNFSKDVT